MKSIKSNYSEKKVYNRKCLSCQNYLGLTYHPLTSKNKLEVCSGYCLENLNKKLEDKLISRTKSRENSWRKVSIEETRQLIILTEEQCKKLLENVQKAEKNGDTHNLFNNTKQVLDTAKKNNFAN